MGFDGGIEIGRIIEKLEKELDEYFGALNEIRMGVGRPSPEKPLEFIYYEQTKELKIPLVSGGIMDQPHIWLMQYAVCMNREKLWTSLMENSRNAQSTKLR